MGPDPHKPLRDDVRLLGELLGDTVRAQAGEAIFATVERVRALAKSARAGNDADFRVLADELSRMAVDDALPIARAFAHFLHLANIAEQHHRVRRRRAYLRDPRRRAAARLVRRRVRAAARRRRHAGPPARGGQRAAGRAGAHGASDRGGAPHAGPEAQPDRRRAGAARSSRPHRARAGRSRGGASAARDRWPRGARATCATQRPTPIDEVRSGLIVFEQSLWDALPATCAASTGRCARSTGRGLPHRRGAAPVRLVDRRRPRRQPARHARRHAPRLPAVALGGGRALPARDRGAARRALDRERHRRSCGRACRAAPSPIASCCAASAPACSATRAWMEALARGGRGRRPGADVYLEAARLAGGAAPLPPIARGHRARPHRRRPARPTCCGASPRSASRWRGSTSVRTRRATPTRSPRSRRRSGSARTPSGTRPRGWSSSCSELASRRPLIPDDLEADARGAGRARHVPHDRRHSRRVARRLRHHDDAQRVGRAGRGAAAEGGCGWRSRCGSSRCSRPRATCSRPAPCSTRCSAMPVVPRADRRPAGSDDRLLGLGEGRRPRRRRLGALQGAGGDRRRLRAPRRRRDAVPRARRQRRPRRRADAPGAAVAAARARSTARCASPSRARCCRRCSGFPTSPCARWRSTPPARSKPGSCRCRAASDEWRACMERLAGRRARGYRRIVYDDPRFIDYFHASTPRGRDGELNIGSRPARRGGGVERGGPARHPVAVRLDADAPDARRLAGRRGGARPGVRARRAGARCGDVPRVAALPVGDRSDRDGAGQGRRPDCRRIRPAAGARPAAAARRGSARAAGARHSRRPGRFGSRGAARSRLRSSAGRSTCAIRTSIRSIWCRWNCSGGCGDDPDARVHTALMVTVNGIAAGMRNTG